MFRAHFGIFSRKWRWLSQKGWTRVQVMTAVSGVSSEQAALTRWRNSGDICKLDVAGSNPATGTMFSIT